MLMKKCVSNVCVQQHKCSTCMQSAFCIYSRLLTVDVVVCLHICLLSLFGQSKIPLGLWVICLPGCCCFLCMPPPLFRPFCSSLNYIRTATVVCRVVEQNIWQKNTVANITQQPLSTYKTYSKESLCVCKPVYVCVFSKTVNCANADILFYFCQVTLWQWSHIHSTQILPLARHLFFSQGTPAGGSHSHCPPKKASRIDSLDAQEPEHSFSSNWSV